MIADWDCPDSPEIEQLRNEAILRGDEVWQDFRGRWMTVPRQAVEDFGGVAYYIHAVSLVSRRSD